MRNLIFSLVTLSLFTFLYFGVLNNTVQAGEGACSGQMCTDFEGDRVACTICCNQVGGITCKGTQGDDVICGDGGVNDIRAGKGNDIICGFGSDDIIAAGGGCDTVFGGDGLNTASSGNDTVHGGGGCDFIDGEDGNDTLKGSACADDIFGGLGATDVCTGGSGIDFIHEASCEEFSYSSQNDKQKDKRQCNCDAPIPPCIIDIDGD